MNLLLGIRSVNSWTSLFTGAMHFAVKYNGIWYEINTESKNATIGKIKTTSVDSDFSAIVIMDEKIIINFNINDFLSKYKNDYDYLHNNCQNFVDRFVFYLTGKNIPTQQTYSLGIIPITLFGVNNYCKLKYK